MRRGSNGIRETSCISWILGNMFKCCSVRNMPTEHFVHKFSVTVWGEGAKVLIFKVKTTQRNIKKVLLQEFDRKSLSILTLCVSTVIVLFQQENVMYVSHSLHFLFVIATLKESFLVSRLSAHVYTRVCKRVIRYYMIIPSTMKMIFVALSWDHCHRVMCLIQGS